jgi:hypothetical protein
VIEGLAEVGARAYAKPVAGQSKGIIDDRFKGAGNARFIRLAPSTVKQKEGSIAAARKAGKVRAGTFFGVGTGSKLLRGNKPVLVNSGRLRAAINAPTHTVIGSPGLAVLVIRGLPDYAVYLQEGTEKMVKRSPIDINEEDRKRIEAAMQKALRLAVGAASRNVPIPQDVAASIPRLA